MKLLRLIQLVLLIIVINSCKDEKVQLGESIYYPSFLWVGDKQTCAEKTLLFDFSQDAINDVNTYAEFAFIDTDGNIIDSNCFQCFIDDKKLINNSFKIDSKTDSINIRFEFSPNAKEGKYNGYLRLISHNLDRVDSQKLSNNESINILQWSLTFKKNMNPLEIIVISILLTILSSLIIWLTIIRPCIFPHFGTFKKSIIVMQNGKTVFRTNASFKGLRKVVLYNTNITQSFWQRLFIGKTITIKSQYFTSKIEITPYKKNAIAMGQNCCITPNPFPKDGVANIKFNSSNTIINLK